MTSKPMAAFYPQGDIAHRAYAVLREQGFKSFWFKLAAELGYRRLILLERSLLQPVNPPAQELALRFDILGESQVNDFLAFRPEFPQAEVLKRLRAGNVCFTARDQGRLISAAWTTTERAWTDFLGCEIALGAGEAYLFDAFTHPAYRGQGVAPALCFNQLAHFRRAGLRRVVRATLPENTPALRAHVKCGFRPHALIGRMKIGPWQYSFQRPFQGHVSLPGE
jgi:ribosomal protein S18 acetylase RimI-like enzyme